MTFRACHCAKCPPEMTGKDICIVTVCNETSYTYCNFGNNFDNKTAKKVLGICVRVPFILLIFYYGVAACCYLKRTVRTRLRRLVGGCGASVCVAVRVTL